MTLDLKEAESELRTLMAEVFPATELVDVSVVPGLNFEGEPSLFVKIVMSARPSREEMKGWSRVMSKFRAWLTTSAADERFPYINFTTPADEREIADS